MVTVDELDDVARRYWDGFGRGRLVGGHQRLKVLQAKGVTEVDVSVVDFDEDRERALNQVQGDWDQQRLAPLLAELEEHGLDLAITGFDDSEIEELSDRGPAAVR